jgi:glycosyltransferase involved in cell wall biosynthesis
MKALVVIPAHNEAASLPTVVADLRRRHPDRDILVVDDGSTDETPAVLEQLPVEWLRLGSAVGVGGAMRAGFRYAAAEGFDTVVRVDGDGQHDHESIEALLEPFARGQVDVVRGSRYLTESSYRAVGFRRLAQRVIARLLSAVTGEPVTDPTSGFWAFGPRAVRLLAHHHPTSYPEPELLLLLHKNKLKTIEVAVQMRERIAGQTSLTAARTTLAMARVLLVLLVVPLRPAIEGSSHE